MKIVYGNGNFIERESGMYCVKKSLINLCKALFFSLIVKQVTKQVNFILESNSN
jgi:hypothetical protein